MAQYIKTNGSVIGIRPEQGKQFTLKELQGLVGGTVDLAYMPSGNVMYLNDNGKLKGLPMNEKASEIWQKEYPLNKYPINNDGLIVGDVLIMSREEDAEQNKED